MITYIHALIAIVSILFTAYTFIYPSKSKLMTAYVLVAATLVSGIIVGLTSRVNILEVCITGLIYLVFIFFGITAIRKKLS